MTGMRVDRRSPIDARALRFLLLFLGGWALVRVMAHWNPVIPPAPAGVPPAPWARDADRVRWATAAAALIDRPPHARGDIATLPGPLPRIEPAPAIALSPAPPTGDVVPAGGGWGAAGRHGLRLALISRLLPSVPGGAPTAFSAAGAAAWMPAGVPVHAEPPGSGPAFWMQRQLAGWSLGGWAYAREKSGAAQGGIAAASQLGGSQAGARLAYGFGDAGRLRAYGRATIALAAPRQREFALGLAFAPVARWPVDIAVERRFAVGPDGRSAFAAMVTGGIGDLVLPGDFRLEAYGQAGIVSARRRDGFADGAVVVDRRLGQDERAALRLGALAAGAVQPGAARVDVGPRLSLRLPHVGEGSRIALDWRQRIAGDASPESGVALTLASDF